MNFKEMLESRDGSQLHKEPMPFGWLYKKRLENKYESIVELRQELIDNLEFSKSLKQECENCQKLNRSYQLSFTVLSNSSGLYGLNLEQGSYHTLEQLITENPAVVARKDFVTDLVDTLLDAAGDLHEHGVYHLCFSPSNVIMRRGDSSAALLLHGSSYAGMRDFRKLFQGSEDYVAPEVLAGEQPTAASDIYSLGQLVKYLYQDATMPMEIKMAVKKATRQEPEKRYWSAASMKKAVKRVKSVRVAFLSLLGAAAVSLLAFSFYNSMIPEAENIEFVKPAPKQPDPDDPLASSLPDDVEMALLELSRDSLSSDEEFNERLLSDKEMAAKAEEIFRRHFTKEAEQILSTIYTNERMDMGEEAFLASSQQAMTDLVKAQVQIAQRAGLEDTRAQRIAGEIIDRITTRKKMQLSARRAASEPAGQGASGSTYTTPATGTQQQETQSTTTPSSVSGRSSSTPQRSRIQRESRREEIDRLMEQNSKVE